MAYFSFFENRAGIRNLTNKYVEPLVSVVIGNYNSRKYLPACLNSLRNQSYQNIEIIFVDDGSTDGSLRFVSLSFPWVKVVLNTKAEKGYAACCDFGARVAQGEYLCFLNVDIELHNDCIAKLVFCMESDRTIGVCGPKLLSLNDRKTVVSMGGFLDIFGFGVDRGIDDPDTERFRKPEDVNFITGAVVLVRREALWASGGWDVDTFAYAEDSDLCWRVLLSDYRVVFEPGSIAYHLQSPSMGRASARKIHFMERNRLLSLLKNYEMPTLLKIMPGWFIIVTARMLYFSVCRRGDIVISSIKAYFEALRGVSRTIEKRAAIQSHRKIPDREILKVFCRQSLEARLFTSKTTRKFLN